LFEIDDHEDFYSGDHTEITADPSGLSAMKTASISQMGLLHKFKDGSGLGRGTANPAHFALQLCPAFCELATSQSRREIASLRDELRQPLMATMVWSTRSNHAGLSRTTKRSPISRLAKARGLTATLKNQAARIIRSDTGCSALTQALSARDKVR
jgi:hypothetical protein